MRAKLRNCMTAILAGGMLTIQPMTALSAETSAKLPNGWLLWHSYSEYSASDSRLYCCTPDGEIQEIFGDFIHAMNGSFGVTPNQIVFMAIDAAADEWDIYLYDDGRIQNLTPNSGFRNEDPKWSPDGRQIVFKRGYWDHSIQDFVYNLALLELQTGEITLLTDDTAEEAMPCFDESGTSIYYTRYLNGIGAIYQMELATGQTKAVYAEEGVNAYYPIIKRQGLYFTKWFSADNHCDQLMRLDGDNSMRLPLNSEQYDCSDACPIDADRIIYSATVNGNYDLYFYDGEQSTLLTAQSTPQNDLGADFYAMSEYEAYLRSTLGDINADGMFDREDLSLLQRFLLTVPNSDAIDWQAADFTFDGRLDAADLSLMKQYLFG